MATAKPRGKLYFGSESMKQSCQREIKMFSPANRVLRNTMHAALLFSFSRHANACLHVAQCLSPRSLPSLTTMTCKDGAKGPKAAFSDSLCDLLVYLMGGQGG